MKKFNFWDIVCGWAVFAIAAATYLLTLEPTASFWDCGEFISSAHKLDVGHPPGAPFFMLMGHFFSLFAKDASQVALCVNALSGLASALTILFLFWTITALVRKVMAPDTIARGIAILGAGAVGALAYTFSDTFWFSAVEGEVYASSSLFTAVVFWLILKWDECADHEGSDKWLILIMYLMGLSIGVHLLNLLTIPAIVMVYYFRRYEVSLGGVIAAFLASVGILGAILYGIIPGIPTIAGWFELLFVNGLHLPFNTGLAIYLVLLFAALGWSIYETYMEKNQMRMLVSVVLAVVLSGIPFIQESAWMGIVLTAILAGVLYMVRSKVSGRLLNTAMMMVAVIVIGYSSYAVLVIRSTAQTPMDQNSPDNVFSLKYYLNREQYGDRPLFYGQTFLSDVERDGTGYPVTKEGGAQYAPKPSKEGEPDEYIVTKYKKDYIYEDQMLFPRIYSSSHKDAYFGWLNVKKEERESYYPTQADNMKFFFNYQVNFMYWRYFMWNFAGRQDDIQNQNGNILHGNWISGLSFIDNKRLGDQSKRPTEWLENKGHNVYYMLPLLLGLLGIAWQLLRRNGDKQKEGLQSFTLTFLLFFLTGLAIVIYLNQTPNQPRERDYAYAGSFYAFCIWIGMGLMCFYELVEKLLWKQPKWMHAIAASLLTVVCLGVPAQMAAQNWDDHDRSKRTVCRDFGANYLKSCDEGGIIFSNGDNDTFPLWYCQEVEGMRTDLRVCNLSYLNTDWYIDQMKRPYYESAALPIDWEYADYITGHSDLWLIRYGRMVSRTVPGRGKEESFEEYTNLLSYDECRKKAKASSDEQVEFTGRDLAIVFPKDEDGYGYDDMIVRPNNGRKGGEYYTKSDLMVIEMIQNNNFERPMYYAATVGDYLGLEPYLELTGLAYRITPNRLGMRVNTEVMYENMMHRFEYGNVAADGIYLDENTLRMCSTHRYMFYRLASAMLDEAISGVNQYLRLSYMDDEDTDSLRVSATQKLEKVLEVLNYADVVLPEKNVPYGHVSAYMAQLYAEAANGLQKMDSESEAALVARAAAERIWDVVVKNSAEHLAWGRSLETAYWLDGALEQDMSDSYSAIYNIGSMAEQFDFAELNEKTMALVEEYQPFMQDLNEANNQ